MLSIPVQLNETEYVLIIALQDANIERIKQHDPAEVVPEKLGGNWAKLTLKQIHITYATEEDERTITALFREGNVRDAVRFMRRGFKYQPTMGDHDGQYGPTLL